MGIIFSFFNHKQIQRENAALTLQSVWRGKQARKQLDKVKAEQSEAATTLQTAWKGHIARKNFGFKQLKFADMESVKTFLVGNDPIITGLSSHRALQHENIALIGTSGLRSLSLVCQLGSSISVPKLIIVDNSLQVILFWRKFRDLVNPTPESKSDFFERVERFLIANTNLYARGHDHAYNSNVNRLVNYENQNPFNFLSILIDKYGLERLCSIIRHTTVIGQSWGDKSLFSKLKNLFIHNQISKTFLYPSNIAHCIVENELDQFFENIQTISPALSIITDLCETHGIPENVTLTTRSNKQDLRALVFPQENLYSASNSSSYWTPNINNFSMQLSNSLLSELVAQLQAYDYRAQAQNNNFRL